MKTEQKQIAPAPATPYRVPFSEAEEYLLPAKHKTKQSEVR
jgi:hypothetical protein